MCIYLNSRLILLNRNFLIYKRLKDHNLCRMQNPFNNSVVHEFIVLYTDRVYDKNKRWFDGTLRFFELNGKIQLQNLEGNVVSEDYTFRSTNDVLQKLLVPSKKYTFQNKTVIVDVLEKSSTTVRDVSFLNKLKKQSELNKEVLIESESNKYGSNRDQLNTVNHVLNARKNWSITKKTSSSISPKKIKGKPIWIDIMNGKPDSSTALDKPIAKEKDQLEVKQVLPRIPRFSSKIYKLQN